MAEKLINIGFGSYVVLSRIVGIFNPNSSPMRRLKEEAREDHRLIDATHGRKTRAIIITDSNHVFLSSLHPETISHRIGAEQGEGDEK